MNEQSFFEQITSPVGPLELEATTEALIALRFGHSKQPGGTQTPVNGLLRKACQQLDEYFTGSRTTFSLPLKPAGTNFQQEVWQELGNIEYGHTITYAQLAKRLGDVNKVRAVGRANGSNPISIIIPCHRVIGSNNKLVGYGGGIENKRWLLQHEGALLL